MNVSNAATLNAGTKWRHCLLLHRNFYKWRTTTECGLMPCGPIRHLGFRIWPATYFSCTGLFLWL